jgi:Zn-dependent protease
VFFNLVLAILNFIPIPPLDGYNFVLSFLPPRTAFSVQRYAPYGMIALLLLVFIPGSPLGALLGLANPVTRVLIGA